MAINRKNMLSITSYMDKYRDGSGEYDPFSIDYELFGDTTPDSVFFMSDIYVGRMDMVSLEAFDVQELDFILMFLNGIEDPYADMEALSQLNIINTTTIFELFEQHKLLIKEDS